ncbi:MAG: carboxypeptidase-like regulatory domain-containing protein [Puniceicoccales bacterium]
MNSVTVVFLGFLSLLQISCALNPMGGPIVTLEATVFDESGEPIENAEMVAVFTTVSGKEDIERARTDEFGEVAISDQTPFKTYMRIVKDGYYSSIYNKIDISEPPAYGELTPRSRSFDVTLRRTIDPRALMAKRGDIEIPVKNEWIGYDLEVSDWIKPHGRGDRGDVLFRYENQFLGYNISENGLEKVRKRESQSGNEWTVEMEQHFYGNWSGRLEMKFPGEGEGIVKVVDGYLKNSEMKMPHLASEEGYKAHAEWEGSMPSKNLDLYQGYFLRVRVVKRGDEIIQANYAKINEEIDFDPRGTISFSYYFNPQINDRNLEFDTDKNLLKNLEPEERVKLP